MMDSIIAFFTALFIGMIVLGVSIVVPVSESTTGGSPTEIEAVEQTQGGQSEAMFTGTVTGTIDDCAFDGICAFIVNESMEVIWANGMMQCLGSMDNDIAVGDNVEVNAESIINDDGSVSFSICTGEDYYIRKQS